MGARDRLRVVASQGRSFVSEVARNGADVLNVLGGDLAKKRMPLAHEDAYLGNRIPTLFDRLREHAPRIHNLAVQSATVRDAASVGNPGVLLKLGRPAWAGLVAQRGQRETTTLVPVSHSVRLDWPMAPGDTKLLETYEEAKRKQWNASTSLDWDGKRTFNWQTAVDPMNPDFFVIPERLIPPASSRFWSRLSSSQKEAQTRAYATWILSQILHGEQGALVISGQLVETMPGRDAKLMAATQVMDEARHVEVFERYLREKLEGYYPPNDNLYTVLIANIAQGDWDLKSLPMNIMIEGLAMSIFGVLRTNTKEPLLAGLLQLVVVDEARHVKFGAHLLEQHYREASSAVIRDREDFAFELALLLHNRFLAHEIYEEFYAPLMTRAEWDDLVSNSTLTKEFRWRLFRGIMPNLDKIGLLSSRIRKHYEKHGLLRFETESAEP